jgi:hypothetical protein
MVLKFLLILKQQWKIHLKGKLFNIFDKKLIIYFFRENEDDEGEDENETESNDENMDDQMGDVDEEDQGETFDEKKWGDEDKEKDEEGEEPVSFVRFLKSKLLI